MEELQKAKRQRLEQMRAKGIGKFRKDDDVPVSIPASTTSCHRASAAEPSGAGDPWCPPHGWIEAPPRGDLFANTFVPSKAPLDARWHARIPVDRRYGPEDALRAASEAADGRPVELVVDLTNSSRYYDPAVFERHGARYVKIACAGKDAPPDSTAVTRFVFEVGAFLAERAQRNGRGIILVHCTHGFNRTGAMLVHHAQRTRPWPKLNENLAEFARSRPNGERAKDETPGGSTPPQAPSPCGIYKPEYITSLFEEYLERRFRTTAAPSVPDWKKKATVSEAPPVRDADVPEGDLFGSENAEYVSTSASSNAPKPGGNVLLGSVDPDVPGTGTGTGTGRNRFGRFKTTAGGNADGSAMRHDDVLGEVVYEGQAREIRNVASWLCGHEGDRFPGSQPVSLARDNMDELGKRPYHVTWKADGTRYMLLLMRDGTYVIDRKFDVRRVQMRFPAPFKTHGASTHNATLLDGEMVVDDLPDKTQRRRFLAYDCVAVLGERLFDLPFTERYARIGRFVIDPRNVFLADAGKTGAYDFSKEPFSVRRKDFAALSGTEKFITEFIPRLTHECDGLIFQPSEARYERGTAATLLKWKFTHLNSVDFLLRRSGTSAEIPKLYVGGDRESLVEVRDPSGGFVMRGSDARDEGDDPTVAADGARLADLDGKIVECAWDKDAAGLGAGAGFRDGEDPGSNPTRGGTVGAWRYMRVRSDKDTPNFVTVYKHTLRSILDDITSEELVRFVRGVLEKQAREAAENGTGYAPPS